MLTFSLDANGEIAWLHTLNKNQTYMTANQLTFGVFYSPEKLLAMYKRQPLGADDSIDYVSIDADGQSAAPQPLFNNAGKREQLHLWHAYQTNERAGIIVRKNPETKSYNLVKISWDFLAEPRNLAI